MEKRDALSRSHLPDLPDIFHCSRGPTPARPSTSLRTTLSLSKGRSRGGLEDSLLARAAGAPDLPDRERGIAVIVAMMGILIISALGTALVLGTATETMIARNFRAANGAAAAADLSLRVAIEELASLGDWNAVLTGSIRSRFADGLPDGDRAPANSTINPTVLSNLANCRKTAPCTTSEMTTITAERPWGTNNPRWRPFLYRALADISAAASGSPFYAVVLVADDPSETDADPLADSAVPGPGAGVILLRATAFGPGGARATVEATIARRAQGDLSLFPDALPVRMLSWRMSR